MCHIFFFKQKTAYEMRISDWSSDLVLFRSAGGARFRVGTQIGPEQGIVVDVKIVAGQDIAAKAKRRRTDEKQALVAARADLSGFQRKGGEILAWPQRAQIFRGRGGGGRSAGERKSVGSGRRGAVRVDPGGCRT